MIQLSKFMFRFSFVFLIIGCNTNHKRKSEKELQDNNEYLPLSKEILSPKNNPSSPKKIALGKLWFSPGKY